jgi:GNAT superfamily N-acetyltransferase
MPGWRRSTCHDPPRKNGGEPRFGAACVPQKRQSAELTFGFSGRSLAWDRPTGAEMMPTARLAQPSDLERLLELFREAEVSSIAEPLERAERIWSETLAREGLALFVSESGTKIAATCMLITTPSLLRGGRGHGFLENVVAHPDRRGQGHGRAVVRAALAEAWARDCYHVLLQSGRKDHRVHRFYESLGFEPGVRVGYVARRPTQLETSRRGRFRGTDRPLARPFLIGLVCAGGEKRES